MSHMSRMYLVDPGDTEAIRLIADQDTKDQISDIMPTEISNRYQEFILLQYQHCCDEYEVSSIILGNFVPHGDLGVNSFLHHCHERKVYCENQLRLLGYAYPFIQQYRRPKSHGRI